MNDYRYLREIEQIAPNNRFLSYITDRVSSDDYRGVQCSQHNRLTYSYFENVISAIYETAGSNVFDIHVGDDRGAAQPQAGTYYRVVEAIKLATGKGTINSVKKNTFPDIARMGFLTRFDHDGNVIREEDSPRSRIYRVKLSDLGVRFATATPFERIKLFTDGVDILTENAASELVELLYLNDYGIDSIDILEFMYILSDDSGELTTNDKLDLLLEYRRLSSPQKENVNKYLKAFCNPENRRALDNKTLLRDYSNWKNESQQIYGLLSNSTYFKVENNKLILNTGNYGIFDPNAKRGTKAKSDYFKYHGIQPQRGYELHHIVPFAKAMNKSDAVSIDDFKNLIYLRSDKHSEFTAAGSKHVELSYDPNHNYVLFGDFGNGHIVVDISKGDALISTNLLPKIKQYNTHLLKKFYHI